MRHANSLVAAACLASLASPSRGESLSYREYPDANRGRQVEGALLLTREDRAWLHEPSLTEVIAKGAGGVREVSPSPWKDSESQRLRLDQLPIEELVARCEDAKGNDLNSSACEQVGLALFATGELPELVETTAFDVEADEGLSLAAESQTTW